MPSHLGPNVVVPLLSNLSSADDELVLSRDGLELAFQNNFEIDVSDVAADPVAAEPKASPERLRRDLVRLVGADSTLVMRVAVDGASQGAVAAELGLTVAAARKRYQRALRRARKHLSAAA
jgi:RNA polymerase sigma-70 factor (ECF subfamily)